jgi:hypothetical protein
VSNQNQSPVRVGNRPLWGWAGSVYDFLSTPAERVIKDLTAHLEGLLGFSPSSSQMAAWIECDDVLRKSFRDICIANPDIQRWSLIFEFELPLEGGRRPDVVVLTGDEIVVLEFKQNPIITPAVVDQVEAYARDLAEYHSASHGFKVSPVVVVPKVNSSSRRGGTEIRDHAGLAKYMLEIPGNGNDNLDEWLHAKYEPLPFLVDAARRIFANEPLPHIRRALATDIPQAVDLLGNLAEQAADEGRRFLAFIAGVPGSGKTLAGLSLVYQRTAKMSKATFLSGNGPLVEVLRDALKSKVFVRDLHAFIKTYGTSSKVPSENVIVFDEAQRAWDAGYMGHKHGIDRSEPDLLIDIAERLDEWAMLVGLVGDGQEIHAGEESGIGQWHDAVHPSNGRSDWQVHCPPRLVQDFPDVPTTSHDVLDLTTSLRSRRADQIHQWVAMLLDGKLAEAARLATSIQDSQFPLYITRDLERARQYLWSRYADQTDARYGLLASARSQGHLPKWGVDSSFPATKKVRVARWYNEPHGHPQSCCALNDVVTEFACQGLELDFPVVCWSTDMMWTGSEWKIRRVNSRYPLQDQESIRRNAYRVLMTRGRDGLLIFIPPDPVLDQTEHALLAAGVKPLAAGPTD